MVDVAPNNNSQISSDDQELAKVLAGVGQDEPAPEPIVEPVEEAPAEEAPADDAVDLDGVRIKALQDIKPLLDKLDLPPDEKFDIYIEVLRASNDTTLLPPAYEITPGIENETTRGMDLLTVIREIDSLNPPEA